MRILFLCNKSPWPPREGGPMAMNMFIEGLVTEGHQVKVLAVNSFKYDIKASDIPATYRDKTSIELIDIDLRVKPVAALRSLIAGTSYHIARFVSARFRDRLEAVLASQDYDVVQLETLYMCPYIETIRAHSNAKIVLRAHNIEHLIWQRIAEDTSNPLKKWYIHKLAVTLKQYEDSVTGAVDGIVAITSKDAAYFADANSKMQNAKNEEVPVIGIPFGIDPEKHTEPGIPAEFPSLFSLGSMNWIPNQAGIRWFLKEVWPDIHRNFPHLKYYLAGREMPAWMRSLKMTNVIVLGEVKDAKEFLASKSIMIVPLFSGSGIRIKIIEGMAAGKTIISTTIGAEGITCTPRSDIMIADTACEFFEAISICVTDQALCSKMGRRAMELIEKEYNSRILVRKLLGFYQELPG